MSKMTCKGYTARVEFDDRDGVFVGRVLGIKAIVGFHGTTVDERRADFKAAIDLLLDDAKARGEAPERPASGKLMLRVPPEVHAAAAIAAEAAGTSLNQWAAKVLGDAARTAPAR